MAHLEIFLQKGSCHTMVTAQPKRVPTVISASIRPNGRHIKQQQPSLARSHVAKPFTARPTTGLVSHQLICYATESGGGDGGGGKIVDSNGGNGDSDDNDDGDEILNQQQAEELAAAKGIALPADFLQVAAKEGLRLSVLTKFFELQVSTIDRIFSRAFPAVRDRLLSDNRFLFKVFVEVAIDSGCATLAEVRKRGKDFWSEFEFYLSDLIVGCVLDCVLVGLMAPTAILSKRARIGATGFQRALAKVPSAVFQASVPGVQKYTIANRAACLLVKFGEYSLAGIFCGFVGQGVANSLMILKRQVYGVKEDDVKVPPLMGTALVWGLFMGTSSNVRYQVVFGLERLVDVTLARRIPAAAYVTTVVVRLANNIIGGENFIDMARWFKVQ